MRSVLTGMFLLPLLWGCGGVTGSREVISMERQSVSECTPEGGSCTDSGQCCGSLGCYCWWTGDHGTCEVWPCIP